MSKKILIFKILYHKYFYLEETLDIDNIGYDVCILSLFVLFLRICMRILKFTRGYTKVFVWFGLVWLFNDISTFVGYLMPKSFS